MAGLLDLFGSEDPRQQGLLGLTAGILGASGPSRMPVSLGQVLGAGLGGFQDGQRQALARQQANQSLQLGDLKLRDAESDLKNQDMLRTRQANIAADLMKMGADGTQGQTTPMPAPQSAAASFNSAVSGRAVAPPALPSASQVGAPASQNEAAAARLMQEAQVYAKYGDFDGANKRYEAAIKLQPKYSTDFRMARGDDGKMHNYVLADNGTWKDTGLGVAPNVTEVDLGDRKQFVDKNSIAPNTILAKGMSPDAAASNRLGFARLNFDKAQANSGPDGLLPDETVAMMAQQYRAGDTSVMQNLGRGAQGAQNIIKLRNEIARQTVASGQGGADLAAKNAEYFGTKAGQRTAGTRIANVEMASNEAQSLIPLARQASLDVQRSGFLPFGKAQVMFDDQTNDPALRKFAAANNALVNVYSRAISPSGTPTVSDKEHAREMLSTAMDQRSYNAVLDQMQAEISAARAAPKAVRQAFNSEVTGKESHVDSSQGSAPAQTKKFDMLPPATQYEGKRMKADNGTIYRAVGGKWVKE